MSRYPCLSMGKWGVVISLPTLLLIPLACAFSLSEINRIVHAIRFFDFRE